MAPIHSFALLAFTATLLPGILAHGNEPDASGEKDWATRHMQFEHHIQNFDAATFFSMHDFDSDGYWEPSEIKRTYGLDNDGTRYDGTAQLEKASDEMAHKVVNDVLELYDRDDDVRVDADEFRAGIEAGRRLPDFGLGPGHHGDDEYEYEIHHFEKYHDENTAEEDLTHPEDIEHFKKHDERAREEYHQEHLDGQAIIEANIPEKFKRQ